MKYTKEARHTKVIREELDLTLDDLRTSDEVSSSFALGEVMGLSRALRLLQNLDNNDAIEKLRQKLLDAQTDAKNQQRGTGYAPSGSVNRDEIHGVKHLPKTDAEGW